MNDSVTIKTAVPENSEEIQQIYAQYVEKTAVTFEYDSPPVEEIERRMKKVLATHPYLVAVQNDEILGFAYASFFRSRPAYSHDAETTIYLRSSCRHSGIGTALYDELEKRLKKQGILNLYACIAVTERKNDEHLNTDSPLFHLHRGFTVAGTFRKCGRKFDKWYDMVWMEKMIGEHR